MLDVLVSKPEWSRQDLLELLQRTYPGLTTATLTWRIHDLKTRGLLHSVGRGCYSALTPLPVFTPTVDGSTSRLVRLAQQAAPEALLCISDTAWLNAMHEGPALPSYRLLETSKGHLDAVYNALQEHSRMVFLNPDTNAVVMYVHLHERAIVLRPLVSEAPLSTTNGITTSPIEKLLVDALAHADLYMDYQAELPKIFAYARRHYALNESRLRRYASRRDRWHEVENLLSA